MLGSLVLRGRRGAVRNGSCRSVLGLGRGVLGLVVGFAATLDLGGALDVRAVIVGVVLGVGIAADAPRDANRMSVKAQVR